MIKLTKINRDPPRDRFNNSDDPTEGQAQLTSPVVINPDSIRCFYPRKENRVGTRITFNDGGGFAVAETFDTVMDLIGGIYAHGIRTPTTPDIG